MVSKYELHLIQDKKVTYITIIYKKQNHNHLKHFSPQCYS